MCHIDDRHPAAPELTLDDILMAERVYQWFRNVGHVEGGWRPLQCDHG
jgi:hypothetical protein